MTLSCIIFVALMGSLAYSLELKSSTPLAITTTPTANDNKCDHVAQEETQRYADHLHYVFHHIKLYAEDYGFLFYHLKLQTGTSNPTLTMIFNSTHPNQYEFQVAWSSLCYNLKSMWISYHMRDWEFMSVKFESHSHPWIFYNEWKYERAHSHSNTYLDHLVISTVLPKSYQFSLVFPDMNYTTFSYYWPNQFVKLGKNGQTESLRNHKWIHQVPIFEHRLTVAGMIHCKESTFETFVETVMTMVVLSFLIGGFFLTAILNGM